MTKTNKALYIAICLCIILLCVQSVAICYFKPEKTIRDLVLAVISIALFACQTLKIATVLLSVKTIGKDA